jgi:GNAT superfamily N-acetyltransferase
MLRPDLENADALVRAVQLQRGEGYRALALWDGATPYAYAGYRILNNLIHGHFMYVDDLVSDQTRRGQGAGAALITELQRIARAEKCGRLVLDTGLANALAQRFYFRNGLLARGLHFAMQLDATA